MVQVREKFGVARPREGARVRHAERGAGTLEEGPPPDDESHKRWLVRFHANEVHRYSEAQVREKFGVVQPQHGMRVHHAVRGEGTLLERAAAECAQPPAGDAAR
jgi:hypothetical protein